MRSRTWPAAMAPARRHEAEVAQLATIPLIFMGGWAGYGIREGAMVMIPISFLQFSQANEREADMLGLQYMYKTGYDPEAFVDFFEKIESLEKKKPGTISKVFATHPPDRRSHRRGAERDSDDAEGAPGIRGDYV